MVEIEVVALKKVVGNKNIWPAILVDIADGDTQPEADGRGIDACRLTDIRVGDLALGVLVATQQAVAALGIGDIAQPFPKVVARGRSVGVVEEVHIQIAIAIIIEESGMDGKAADVQTVIGCRLAESAVLLVDKELVVAHAIESSHFCLGGRASFADVDVGPAVAIDVHNGYASAPDMGAGHASGFRHVFEDKIALIEVQLIPLEVACEVNIQQSILIKIRQTNPTAIVKIPVGIGVDVFGDQEGVLEGFHGLAILKESRRLVGKVLGGILGRLVYPLRVLRLASQ